MPSTNYVAFQDEKVKEAIMLNSTEAQENMGINVLFDVSDDFDYSKAYTAVEGGTGVSWVDEQGNLANVDTSESYEKVLTSREMAGKVVLTYVERLKRKDPSTLMDFVIDKKTPVAMADIANFVERETMKMMNDGFTTVLAPDGQPIYGTHTYNSSTETFTNSSTTPAGETALQELEQYAGDFKDAFGKPMPLSLTTLVAKKGSTAARNFRQVLAGDNKLQAATIGNVNIYNNGTYTLIETPFLTSDTAWFAFDPRKDNSNVVEFVERPSLKTMITRENMDEVQPVAGSMKYGCVYLPVERYGSTGV